MLFFDVSPSPRDVDDFPEHDAQVARWVPQQHPEPVWQRKPLASSELYDRCVHFYYLVNQPLKEGGDTDDDDDDTLQDHPWFSEWLVAFAEDWGSFLDSPESIKDVSLEGFAQYAPQYNISASLKTDGTPNTPSGWRTFNQFFARRLNPGLRPVAEPTNNKVPTAPTDCVFVERFDVADDGSLPEITIKGTHRVASVRELLRGSRYADAFKGGVFAHYFLGPHGYHRYHLPVAGKVVESYVVLGKATADVRIGDDGEFDVPDSARKGYEFAQARGVLVVDTKDSPFGDVGLVAVVPVGMAQVDSVNMIHEVLTDGHKGDEFGYFLFGGSDIAILFQAKANAHIDTNPDPSLYRLYGTPIGTLHPDEKEDPTHHEWY